ncbi:hypothetical protein DYB32_006619, partial [Aphanomyces invadans]
MHALHCDDIPTSLSGTSVQLGRSALSFQPADCPEAAARFCLFSHITTRHMPKKALSLDEAVAQGLRPSTPRSLEACLRTGIDPDEIVPRYLLGSSTRSMVAALEGSGQLPFVHPHVGCPCRLLEDFVNKMRKSDEIEREAAQIRFHRFEEGRQMKIGLLKKERLHLIESGFTASPLSKKLASPSPTK